MMYIWRVKYWVTEMGVEEAKHHYVLTTTRCVDEVEKRIALDRGLVSGFPPGSNHYQHPDIEEATCLGRCIAPFYFNEQANAKEVGL